MKTFVAGCCLFFLSLSPAARGAEVPALINHQGRVAVDGVNFDGTGKFKFALVDGPKGRRMWSNDGTTGDGEPDGSPVELHVTKGLYSVILGDRAVEGMSAIEDRRLFEQPDVRLRIWFDDGSNGFQQLEPDQRLAPDSYLADGSVTGQKIVAGVVGTSHLADGSVSSNKLARGAVVPPVALMATTGNLEANVHYSAAAGTPAVFALPLSANAGDTIRITGAGAGGWSLPGGIPHIWESHEPMRPWTSIASSADCRKLLAGTSPGSLYTSSDFGSSWVANGQVGSWTSVASSSDGSRLYAMNSTIGANAGVFLSIDGGGTWSHLVRIDFGRSVSCSADGQKVVATQHGFFASGGGLHVSQNGGADWTATTSLGYFTCAAVSASGSRMAAGPYGGPIYVTSSFGAAWNASNSPSAFWTAIAGSDDGMRLAAVTFNQPIYVSADGGQTWEARETARDWQGITSSADGSRLAAVANGSPVYVSTDFGQNWMQVEASRDWRCITSSADGLRVVAGVNGECLYTSAATIASGGQGSDVLLHYSLGGQWQAVGPGTHLLRHEHLADGAVTERAFALDVGAWKATGNNIFRLLGNVGIGTATPNYRFSLGGHVASTSIALYDDGTHVYGLGIAPAQFRFHVESPTARFSFLDAPDGNELMTILGTGNVGIGRNPAANRLEVEGDASKSTAGAWLANSDRRIKTDIQPVTGALETINKVKPVTFRYTEAYRKEHPDIKDVPYYNVVAQEFREVFPNAVNSSGEKLPDGSEILQVDTYPATITALAAIRELNAKLAEKDVEIADLHAENDALATRLEKLERAMETLASGSAAKRHPISIQKK